MTEKEFYDAIGGNYTDAVERLMKDSLIRKFVLKFNDDPSFDGLKSAITEKRTDDAFSYAHTLKGVALNLAFARLSASSAELTDALRPQNRDKLNYENINLLFEKTEADYNEVISAIEKFE